MAPWRSAVLEALIGGPLDATGLTEQTLQGLVDNSVGENEQLDFKGAMYTATKGPKGDWSSEQEFAKDVAALANHLGGIILIGVAEDSAGNAKSLVPLAGKVTQEEDRLRRALANHTAPHLGCGFVAIPAGVGGFYLAVIVPPSGLAPHAVVGQRGGKTALIYPIRDGAGTRWMGESELADRYFRRFAGAEEKGRRVRSVIVRAAVLSVDPRERGYGLPPRRTGLCRCLLI